MSGLLALAVSAAAHGLGHLGGPAGIVVAIVMLLLLGVSAAGGAVTYEFEPGFYGAVSSSCHPVPRSRPCATSALYFERCDWRDVFEKS